jgi:hypothetical protein
MVEAGNTELGSALLGTTGITDLQHLICWLLGAFSLIVNIILKFIPMNAFFWVANKVDLEGEGTEETNKVNNMFKNAQEQYQRRMSHIVDGPIKYSEAEMTDINNDDDKNYESDNDLDGVDVNFIR